MISGHRDVRGRRLRRALLLLALWVFVLGSPSAALANSTPTKTAPASGGLVLPSTTTDVRIERETLKLDLTPDRDEAQVSALYELQNVSGKDVVLDLLFIAPNGQDLSVALDRTPVEVVESANAQLPAEWAAPNRGLDPRTGEEYELDHLWSQMRTQTWTFRISVPGGARATLSADYRCRLGYDRARADYILRHLVYVLGPARDWAGFGTLEVTVAVPADTLVASSPPLHLVAEVDGVARYAGTFDGVPAELLRVSTMIRPSPLDAWVEPASLWLPFVPGIILAGFVGSTVSRVRGWLAASVLAGGATFVATLVAGTALSWLVTDWLFPNADELSNRAGLTYLSIFSALALAPFCSSVVAAIWAGIGSARRARRTLARQAAVG